jgi:hypothetical protein
VSGIVIYFIISIYSPRFILPQRHIGVFGMVYTPRIRGIPQVWQIAVLGALGGLAINVVGNSLSFSGQDPSGSIFLFGTVLAGGIAVARSADPGAAGLRTAFIGAIINFILSIPPNMAYITSWKGGPFMFTIFSVVILSVSCVLGVIFGRIGGWITNTVTAHWLHATNGSV